MKRIQVLLFLGVLVLASCKKEQGEENGVTIYKASGNITPTLDAFRSALGNVNAAPGATGGRREVNWDGVPDTLLNRPLPLDFFNPAGASAVASRQRGPCL